MRIRTIKPEFWMHEGLAKCSEFSRLLAIALLNWSDDEGYFMANPVLIRGQVFPFEDDSKKIPRSLQELSGVGWIQLGRDSQGRSVGRVINFSKHQRVDKPKTSTIKESWVIQDDSKNDPGMLFDESKEEGKGREQGKEHSCPSLAAARSSLVDELWSVAHAKSRTRSSKAQVDAMLAKTKNLPSHGFIVASLINWSRCEEWNKEGGQFAQGLHLWVKNRKWESEPENHTQIKINPLAPGSW